ncbi:MAG TPA: arginine deiminase family protein [Vicinamibacteria bacterium]|nr:arginine deiminase family protein [Vicinamibacteria bacterium]
MANYGVRNAYGDLKRVVVHRPGPELELVTPETLEEFHFERPVDRKRFLSDYDAMLGHFQAAGVETLLLTDILQNDADAMAYMSRRPNMTYTRDLAVVFESGAVLMSPHLKGRWGDQLMLARAFERLGVPILGAIEPPGFLEGGGVTLLGDDTAVASLCDRANETGTRALRNLVLGRDVEFFLEVPLPFGHIHIDGIFMVLDIDLALIYPEPLRVFPCRLFQAGKSEPRHTMFEELLDRKGIRTIPITLSERKGGHLNLVVTKKSRAAVGFDTASRVGSELARYGWQLHTFPSQELFKGNGGPHCMTCPIQVR